MTQYLELKENDIREIMLKYDLELSGLKFIEVGSGNTNYLVSSAQEKFILTLFEIGFLRTQKLIRLLYLLEKHKFPSNRIRKTADGDEIASFRGKAVLLKPYIPGKVIEELNDEMLSQVGSAIARLNEIPGPDYLPDRHAYGLETFSRVMDKGINPEYENWVGQKYKSLKKTIPSGLPRGLIHGDVFFDNVLFDGTEFKALIDFEEACIYYKIFDLGMAVVGMCTEGSEIILPKVRSLVKGYQTIRILEGVEKEILQLFIEYAALATSSWRFWKYNIDTPIKDMSEKYLGMVNIARAAEAISEKEFMKEVFEWGN
jgi:homoserine kinase type II